MKLKIKKRYILIIAILLVIVLFFVLGGGGSIVPVVETIAVSRGDVESIISVSGTVCEKNKNNVYIENNIKVKNILVEENDEVKKGQKIVDFDMDTLYSNLDTLKISKEVQELNYQKATMSNDNGLLSLVSTQNGENAAKEAFERAEALYEVGAISKVEYDNAKTAYDNAKAGLDMSKNGMEYDILVMQKNIETTQIKIDDLEKQISKLKSAMVSPANGIINSINMTEGAFASPSMPIYKIINNDQVEIKCAVKEFTVKNLSVGQKVYITGDAFDGFTYEGHIKSIAPVASTSTMPTNSQTTIEVIVDVDSEDTLLKSGLNVTCDVVSAESKDTLIIPVTSFSENKDGKVFVYKIENEMLKSIPVEIGINSDEYLEIKTGLNDGDKIVKTIKSSYSDGLKVTEER